MIDSLTFFIAEIKDNYDKYFGDIIRNITDILSSEVEE